MGCLIAPFVYAGRFLRWAFTSGWKGWVVLALVVILLWVGICQCSSRMESEETVIKDYPPSQIDAPYLVQTFEDYYYADRVTRRGSIYTMFKYWEPTAAGSWLYVKKGTLDENKVGEITVRKRKVGE